MQAVGRPATVISGILSRISGRGDFQMRMDDWELLQSFVRAGQGSAFAELVRRHIDMVYSAARRQTHDAATAEDIAQEVFILLARKAATIRRPGALSGWLLAATRGIAMNARRSDARRRRRESAVAAMKGEQAGTEDWEQISRVLDEAVGRLRPKYRDALTLRYFQNRSTGEVAALLGISQEAANKRLSRGIQHLREMFRRHGVHATEAGLSALFLSSAVLPAPPGLSAQVAGAALSSTALTASGHSILKGAELLMASAKAKVVAACGGILLCGVSALVLVDRSAWQTSAPLSEGAPPGRAPSRDELEARFREVFALSGGEVVRRIPWNNDRQTYLPAERINAEQDTIFVAWQDNGDRPMFRLMRPARLEDVLIQVAGIWPQETSLSAQQLQTPIAGDWAYRAGSSQASLAAAVAQLAPEAVGAGNVLHLEPAEREVIVVRGTPDFRSLREITYRGTPRRILTFHHGAVTGSPQLLSMETLGEALQHLGMLTGRPIVIETPIDLRVGVESITYRTALQLSEGGKTPPADEIRQMLDSLHDQSSLDFSAERRSVPIWNLVPHTP